MAGPKCSYLDKGGSKVLLTLNSNSYDPHTILRTPPLPRLDHTTQGTYPASSCVTSSAVRHRCYCTNFLIEGREAHKGKMTFSRPCSLERARAAPSLMHPVLHPLPPGLSAPTLGLWGSSESQFFGHSVWNPIGPSQCVALGLALQLYFHPWRSWQPPKEVWKPRFPVEETVI